MTNNYLVNQPINTMEQSPCWVAKRRSCTHKTQSTFRHPNLNAPSTDIRHKAKWLKLQISILDVPSSNLGYASGCVLIHSASRPMPR